MATEVGTSTGAQPSTVEAPLPQPPDRLTVLENAVAQLTAAVRALMAPSPLASAHATSPVPPPPMHPPQSSSTPSAPHVAPLKLGKPPRFSGKASDTRCWLNQIRTYLALSKQSLDDPTCVVWASTLLDGTAAQWFQALQAQTYGALHAGFANWEEFEAAVRNQFEERFPADRARDRLATLKQRTSVAAYVSEFTSLLVHLPMRHEGDNLHSFMRGLKPHLAEKVAMAMPETLQAAIDVALKADGAAMHVLRLHRVPPPSTSHRSDPTPMELNHVAAHTPSRSSSSTADVAAIHVTTAPPSRRPFSSSAPLKPLTPEERARLREQNKCFRCRKPGHIAADCPLNNDRSKSKPKN